MWFLWLLLTVCGLVNAAGRTCSPYIKIDQSNRFDFPAPSCFPNNYTGVNVYPLGTKLLIKWATTQPRINLIIWQADNSAAGTGTLLWNVSSSEYTTYDFTGYPPQPLSSGITFFFAVYVPGLPSSLFQSDYFNLTDTSGNQTSATVTVTASSGSSTPTSSGSSSAAIQSSSPSSSSNDTGKYIGIGVGAGLGVIIILGALLAWYFTRRIKALQHQKPHGNPEAFNPNNRPPSPIYNDKFSTIASVAAYGNSVRTDLIPLHHQHHYNQQYQQQQQPMTASELEHSRDRYAMLSSPNHASNQTSIPPAELATNRDSTKLSTRIFARKEVPRRAGQGEGISHQQGDVYSQSDDSSVTK